MPQVLVTGGANGLGAMFVERYSSRPGTQVISIDIEPQTSSKHNVQHHTVDMSSEQSILQFADTIKGDTIDLIVHSAGIRGLVPSLEYGRGASVEACETIGVMDAETMERTFRINTIGTFLLLRALMPCLRRSEQAKVIIMSSRMGSVGNNQTGNRAAGGGYAYRASKAALNAVVRSFAVDVPEVVFVMCHPGRVETKLVRWTEDGAIQVGESVDGLIPLIDSWTREDSGKFYDRFGERIEW